MRDYTKLRVLSWLMVMTQGNRLHTLAFGLQPKHLACLLLSAALLIPSMTTSASAPSSPTDEIMVQGTQAYQRGAYEDALGKWKEAARQYETQGQPRKQSQALVAAARAAESLGQTKQALQLLELASALAQRETDALWRATVLAQLGHTYLTARQLDAASTHLTQAHELAKQASSPALTAPLLNDLGILHALQNRHEEALTSFTDSVQLAQQAHLPIVELHARVNAARTNIQLNQPMNSRIWADQALDQVNTLPASREKSIGFMNIGLLYRRLLSSFPDLHDPLILRAAGALQESATLAEQLGDARTLSFAFGHLGHVYESEQRLDEALSFTRRAIFSAQSVDAPESLYRWQWQLGRQLAATGKLDEAIASYRQATVTLQPIRPAVAVAAAESSWLDEDPIRPLFFEQADLLLQRASLTEEQPAATRDLLAARDAIEAYKAAELRDYFKDECVDALQARLTKFDRLAANTAVIYPILFPTRMELLVSLPSGMTRIAVPVGCRSADEGSPTVSPHWSRNAPRANTSRMHNSCTTGSSARWNRSSQSSRLRPWCLCRTARFEPSPWLRFTTARRFSSTSLPSALTPGITLTDPRPLNREKVRFLTVGLTKAVQGFPSLPYVAEEVETIRSLFSADQLMNQDFRAATVGTGVAGWTVWDLAYRHAWEVFDRA